MTDQITEDAPVPQNVSIRTNGNTVVGDSADPVDVDMPMLEATLEYIRPALQADGGDLILLGVEDGVVNLEMVGACGGCPLSMMTLKAGIERILTDRVPGVREVTAV